MSSPVGTQHQKFNFQKKISRQTRERCFPADKNLSTTLGKFSTAFGQVGDVSNCSPDVATGSQNPDQCSQGIASTAISVCRSLFGASGSTTGPGMPHRAHFSSTFHIITAHACSVNSFNRRANYLKCLETRGLEPRSDRGPMGLDGKGARGYAEGLGVSRRRSGCRSLGSAITRIRRMTRRFDVMLRRIRYNNQKVNLNRAEPSWRTRRAL